MEEVYAREEPKGAAVIARETGKGGRSVYIPWNIGEVFWTCARARPWPADRQCGALGARHRPSVEVAGDGMIDIGLRESDDGLVISLVNLTNPMMMKGPLRAVMPIGRQVISAALPADAQARPRGC